MEVETRLQGLFARYVEHHVEHGANLSLEGLCRQAPELLEPLQTLVLDYHEIDRTLATPAALQIGVRVGPYQILGRLGTGGMGEVFKAEDLKLGRMAAIKVLHPEASSNRERLLRFEQEARSASALNHPNIITIYDIDRHRGAPYIAMEFVEGRTLADLMGAGRLPLVKTLNYAIQIVLGLARAHSQGIVHRDIKPDNIMVTEEGLVKILDFGLAKLTEHSRVGNAAEASGHHPETQEGRILGTAPYMSPEQATGQRVDYRSDIFSFGSVLYEMVTGKRPFSGISSEQLLAAIVEKEPESASDLMPSIPIELDRIIHRALQKDPERRFQSTIDFKVELMEVREELETGQVISAARVVGPKAKSRPRLWVLFAALAAIFAMVSGVQYFLAHRRPAHGTAETIQLTSLEGREIWPALSPDGRQVAYVWEGGGNGSGQLYVKLVDVGEPLQLTRGSHSVSSPTWSPDGNRIAFLRSGTAHREVVEIPALGGSERVLGTTLASKSGLAWSPDGDLLAVVDKASVDVPDAIFLLSSRTGEKWQLSEPPPEIYRIIGDLHPRFSPDGKTVAFARQRRYLGNSDLFVVPVAGGKAIRLTFDDAEITDVEWSPKGRSIIFASERAGLRALWSIPRRGGDPVRLVVGEGASGVSVGREGDRLVYSQLVSMVNLYRVAGPAAAESAPAERIIGSTGFNIDPHYSPDGSKIVFGTMRSGKPEVWICGSGGEACRLLAPGFNPSWSPDGASVVYCSGFETGTTSIYIISAAGGIPRRLTEGPEDYLPSWSRDGESVYFLARTDSRAEIWKIPAIGGQARQITHGGGVNAVESEDGRYLFFATHDRSRQSQIWRMPLQGGEKMLVVDWGPDYMNWDLWQDRVVYLEPGGDRPPALEAADPETGETTVIAELDADARASRGVSVSPDGQWIVFGRRDVSDSNLVLVENLKLD